MLPRRGAGWLKKMSQNIARIKLQPKQRLLRPGRDPMHAGTEWFRSAQRHASAASLFVEMPWVPLKLLFRALLKELQNSQKIADFRISTKFDSGRKMEIRLVYALWNDLKCLSFLCGVGGTTSLEALARFVS